MSSRLWGVSVPRPPVLIACASLALACGATVIDPECQSRPPRLGAVIVLGRVTDPAGAAIGGANVVIETVSPADTTGACSGPLTREWFTTTDPNGEYREKLHFVHGPLVCATARAEAGGQAGRAGVAKLEMRADQGPACTPDSLFDVGRLDIVIGGQSGRPAM